MVGKNNKRVFGSSEPMSECLQGSNNSEEFPVVSVVLCFSIGESLRQAANRSPFSFRIFLTRTAPHANAEASVSRMNC